MVILLSTRNYLNKIAYIFLNPLLHKISVPYIKWCWCHFKLRSHDRHHGTIDDVEFNLSERYKCLKSKCSGKYLELIRMK